MPKPLEDKDKAEEEKGEAAVSLPVQISGGWDALSVLFQPYLATIADPFANETKMLLISKKYISVKIEEIWCPICSMAS